MGYRRAAAKAHEILNEIAMDSNDSETLKMVAMTAMTGKGTEKAREPLAELVVNAVMQVEDDGKVEKDHINIHRIQGATINDSKIVNGVVIDKGRADNSMPKTLKTLKSHC